MHSDSFVSAQSVLVQLLNEKHRSGYARRRIQIITKNPLTHASKFILPHALELAQNHVLIEAIFHTNKDFGRSATLLRKDPQISQGLSNISYRCADFTDAGDIIEQINFDNLTLWTGQKLKAKSSMPIEGGQITCIEASADSQKMASMAFRSLWAVSGQVSDSVLSSTANVRHFPRVLSAARG